MIRCILGALSLALAGCCVTPPPTPPGGPCGGFPCPAFDSGPPRPIADGGVIREPFDLCAAGAGFGASCESSCSGRGVTCFSERRATARAMPADGGVPPGAGGGMDVDAAIDPDAGAPDGGLPDGGTAEHVLDAIAFPGGLCSIPCTASTDCGSCGTCVDYALAGRARLRGLVGTGGVCRPRCEFGCGAGTACDLATGACLEACTSDDQCRFYTEDVDGDGTHDVLAYDASEDIACVAGSCSVPPPPFGGACFVDSQCDPGYACLTPSGGQPGRCARVGCTPGDPTCGPGARCVARATGAPVCVRTCVIGAETTEEVWGADGHGAGCDPGFQCAWDREGFDASSGVCLPGLYRDTPDTPNTGAPCTEDDECWSPYGRGYCITPHEHGQGVCAVLQCVNGASPAALLPGVAVGDPTLLCDPARGLSCVSLSTAENDTLCVQSCANADECLLGWACTRLLGTDQRVCALHCELDGDCPSGGRCQRMDTSPCDGRPGLCFCR